MADRRAALEERRRKLEELKRAKEAPASAAAVTSFVPPPTLPSVTTSAMPSVAAPSASPTSSALSGSSAMEPLLSDLLSSGPNIETPALDAAARAKRLNALAPVPDVVLIDLSGGSTKGGSKDTATLPKAFLSCEAAIQTEEDDDAVLFPAAPKPILDDASASAVLKSEGFTTFLSGAASLLEQQLGAGAPSSVDSSAAAAAPKAQEKKEEGMTVLARLFEQSLHSAATTMDTSSSGGLGPGFSPIITLLEVPASFPFPTSGKQPLMPCVFPEGAPISDVAWSSFSAGTLAVSYTTSKARRAHAEAQQPASASAATLFQQYAESILSSFSDMEGEGGDNNASQHKKDEAPPLASVLIWNMETPGFPVAALTLGHAAASIASLSGGGGLGSDLSAIRFHPHAPHLLVGGTNAGQLLVWDLRGSMTAGSGSNGPFPVLEPVICSGFGGGGHVNAVSSLLVAGTAATAASSLLLTLSGEGRACQWSGVVSQAANASSQTQPSLFSHIFPHAFLEPSSSSRLSYVPEAAPTAASNNPSGGAMTVGGSPLPAASSTAAGARDIPVSCASFSSADPSRLYVGGQEGAVYVLLYGGSASQLQTQARLPAHYTCVTAVAPHPSRDVPLLLTSSYDGTIKLWNTELKEPSLAATFDAASLAYASDVTWSPTHPAVFAGGDADGNVRLFHVMGGGGSGSIQDGNPAVAGLVSGAAGTNAAAAFTALAIASGNTARGVTDVTMPVGFYRLAAVNGGIKDKANKVQSRGPAVTRVRFSPDGSSLAIGTLNGELHILSISSEYRGNGGEDAVAVSASLAARWSRS